MAPGTVAELLQGVCTGLPQEEVARRLGVSSSHLSNFLAGRVRVSGAVALRLGQFVTARVLELQQEAQDPPAPLADSEAA